MWTDFYLKADSETDFNNAIPANGLNDIVFDVLGDLSTPSYVDANGNTVSARNIQGWHVNVRCMGDLPVSLKQFMIDAPAFPKRKFFDKIEVDTEDDQIFI